MSSAAALQSRLKELSTILAQAHPLVLRLKNLTTAVGQGNEARLELGAEIHHLLKDAEGELELLKVDVDGLETGGDSRRKGQGVGKEQEKERIVAMTGRLAQDLIRTRVEFRNAQLQAKRNAELAKRKERELLFSRSQSAQRKKESAEKLTQDDIAMNASSDVTAALRRTHQLMQAELSRSQFAQQTLEQSTAALSSLSESYTGLDSLLSSSRNLIGSLLRSQKSDTWYLETAFYVLVGTIAWLLFRRVLYGPLWWIVWLPFKFLFRFVSAILGVVGITAKSAQPSTSLATPDILARETPIIDHTVEANIPSPGDAGWDLPVVDTSDSDRVIDRIAEMVEASNKQETNIDDISPEEEQRQAEMPTNSKKRMYEATEVVQNQRDEL